MLVAVLVTWPSQDTITFRMRPPRPVKVSARLVAQTRGKGNILGAAAAPWSSPPNEPITARSRDIPDERLRGTDFPCPVIVR